MKKIKVKVAEKNGLNIEDKLKGDFEIKEEEHLFTGEIFQSAVDGSFTVKVHDIGTFRIGTKELIQALVKQIIKERI